MRDEYIDAIDSIEFDTIEDALMTKCPMCGTPLDWELKLVWIDKYERNFIHGYSSSCNIRFEIRPCIDFQGTLECYTIHLE